MIICKLEDAVVSKYFRRRGEVGDLTRCCLDRTHFNLIPPAQLLTSRKFFSQLNFNKMQFQKMEVGGGISESGLGFTTTDPSHPTSALQ